MQRQMLLCQIMFFMKRRINACFFLPKLFLCSLSFLQVPLILIERIVRAKSKMKATMVMLYHCHPSQCIDPFGYAHWPRKMINVLGQIYVLFAEKTNSEYTDS